MSQPPPPPGPVISPDGKYYWDGNRWVPRFPPQASPPGTSNTGLVAAVLAVVVLLLVAGLVWYFGFYDTAAGKCNRGDLGACVVYEAQTAASASASASVAVASASAAEASAAQSGFVAAGCTVGPGDGSHNVRLTVSDPASPNNQAATCEQLLRLGWAVAPDVDGATQVCQVQYQDGGTITVTDTGGQYYGGLACKQLNQSEIPTWPIAGA